MSNAGSVCERISQWLRERIERGELPEGASLPSENELAARFETSRAHARQALRDLELESYIIRSQGRRSVVAPASRRSKVLRLTEGEAVAFSLPVYHTTLSREILHGFMSEISRRGRQAIAYNFRFDVARECEFLRQARRSGFSGLALWLQNDRPEVHRVLETFLEERFPVVLVDRYVRNVETDFVGTDNLEIGYRLTRAVVDRGHRRIGFIHDGDTVSSAEDRLAGYRRALAEAGIPFRRSYCSAIDPTGSGAERPVIDELMARRQPPTAFVCIHDFLAKALAQELKRLGYRVPRDLLIAAVDDEHFAESLHIPMLTAAQPSDEIGRQAAELLLARIRDPQRAPDRRFLDPTDLRDRTGAVAATVAPTERR